MCLCRLTVCFLQIGLLAVVYVYTLNVIGSVFARLDVCIQVGCVCVFFADCRLTVCFVQIARNMSVIGLFFGFIQASKTTREVSYIHSIRNTYATHTL